MSPGLGLGKGSGVPMHFPQLTPALPRDGVVEGVLCQTLNICFLIILFFFLTARINSCRN